jgi:uncharacterized protein YqfB (UPF0267 family)
MIGKKEWTITNKTKSHYKTKILLKVILNIKNNNVIDLKG